jgi:signal transduction histidine kinase
MRMPWRLPTVRWPTFLLLASIGLTTLGVVEASRAIRSQRAVAEHALRDYAGFAAWSYAQHLRELLSATAQEALGAVNHGENMHTSRRIPHARELAHYLPYDARCGCHRPRHGPNPGIFFGWVLGTDTLGTGVNTHPDPAEGWEVDRPLPTAISDGRMTGYTAAERAWIVDTLTRQIRARVPDRGYTLVIGEHEGAPRLLLYTLMPTAWGDTVVYGAEYTRAAFDALLADVMYDRGLLPDAFTRGHGVREVLQVQVSDARGATLFESERVDDWALDATTRLAPALGALQVRARIRPELAGNLVIGGLPKSRLPFLVGLLALAAALALVAVGQIRREGELARMRGAFVDSISHELRTPLAQMRLYLETLRLGRFETDAQRAWSLDNVERETTRLSHLVERVLRFSRLGKPEPEARVLVDVAAEVERIVAEFRPLAAARRARMDTAIAPVPPIAMRPDAMRHLMLNLLDNAVKYGPAGQAIHVGVASTEGEIRIEVADGGPGVPRADREAIWHPYTRGRTAGHTAGSGIGLAIVRAVAEQHGGRAWVADTAAGGGARFVVALPVGAPAPALATAHAEPVGG